MANEANFHADFSAGKLRDTSNARARHDHVVAVGKIVDNCHHRTSARRTGDKGVSVCHADSV